MADLSIPAYFPLTVSKCAQPTNTFYQCFSEKGAMRDEQDREAGKRGLAECREELAAYKKCMDKHATDSKHYFPEKY